MLYHYDVKQTFGKIKSFDGADFNNRFSIYHNECHIYDTEWISVSHWHAKKYKIFAFREKKLKEKTPLIGKVAVPVELLVKPSELRTPEVQLMKLHPQIGYDLNFRKVLTIGIILSAASSRT